MARRAAFNARAERISYRATAERCKMMYWGHELPAFLRDVRPLRPCTLQLICSRAEIAASKATRGRPRKGAWARIEELIREMHTADRKTPHKVLASDVIEKVKTKFDRKDVPALGTVERRMKSKLKTDD